MTCPELRRPYALAVIWTGYALFVASTVLAQPAGAPLSTRDLEIRDRYQALLASDPYQAHAFDRTYQTYLDGEGVAAWVEGLEQSKDDPASLILIGRIHARQLETARAIASIEKARDLGAAGAQVDWLLGKVYADAGRFVDAVPMLTAAAAQLPNEETRAQAIRLLGDVQNRLGNRDAAIDAWKRLAESSNGDAFAQWDLAGIYEDHALWARAAEVYDAIATRSEGDPYDQCRALRAKAGALLQLSEIDDAIVTLEAALRLASPGNWLFNDLSDQLIAVYDGRGDLDGLADYLRAQVDAAPASVEYRALLAEVYTRLKDVDAAETEYRTLLDRDPDNLAAQMSLVRLYVNANRTDDAAGALRTLAARYPRDTDYIRQLGELYWNAGEEDRAVTTWRSIVDSDDSPARYAELADWLTSHKRFDEAIDAYRTALASKQDRTWQFRLAELHARLEDDASALSVWMATLSDTSTASELAEVGRLLDANGFLEEAESLFTRALAQDPAHHDSRHALAALLARTERHEESIPHFERLANTNDSDYWQLRGERGLLMALNALGTLEAKQQEWEQAVSAAPDAVPPKLRLARLYESRGNHLGAAELYAACMTLEPASYAHREALANAFLRGERYNQAAETYRALVEDQPSRARGYMRELLSIYRRLNDAEREIEAAERVVELAPTDAQARVQLAQVYLSQGRTDDGFLQFRHAIRLEPDQASLHLLYGDALIKHQRFADARDAFQRLLKQSDDRAARLECLRRLASIHVELESLDELTREYERRLRATPNVLDAYAELAAIYTGAGQPDMAFQALERAHHRVDDRETVLHLLLNAAFDANDLQKTIAYTEELLAVSDSPDVHVLVRLGRAYADLRQLETAVATWARIHETYPNDPDAWVAEANALAEYGYLEDATACERTALDLDPFDSRLRVKFAQHLAEQEHHAEALDEYFLALEYGESNAKSSTPLPRNSKRRAPDFRTATVQKIIAFALPFDLLDVVLDRFEQARSDNPKSQTARNNLIAAYEALRRTDDVIALAEESLQERPDDTALIQKLAGWYAQANRLEEAAELYLQLAAIEPSREREITLRAVAFYQQAQNLDAALALLEAMHEASPTDLVVARHLAMSYGAANRYEAADALFAELRNPDAAYWTPDAAAGLNLRTPQHVAAEQVSITYAWTAYLEQSNRADEARQVYESMLTQAVDRPTNPGGRATVYQVMGNGQRIDINRIQMPFQRVFTSVPSPVVYAATKLLDSDFEIERILDEALSRPGQSAESVLQLKKVRIATQLLEGHEGVIESIDALLTEYPHDLELYNASLLAYEQQLDYTAVLATYATMKALYPQHAAEIEQGEMSVAMQEGDFERVAGILESRMANGAATNTIVALLQRLYYVGGRSEATPLLETIIAREPVSLDALMLAARIRSDEGDTDGAVQLAEAAWEHLNARPAGAHTPARQQHVQMLNGIYARAGRTNAFLKMLRDDVDAAPRSLPHRAQLAAAYTWNNKRDEAIEQYEAILEIRPRDFAAKRALADLYASSGDVEKAIDLYSAILTAQPGAYREISNQLGRLYQQNGHTEEVVALEDSIVRRLTSASDIVLLAQRALQRKDYERARTFFRRALTIDPANQQVHTEMARSYVVELDYEGARKALDAMLDVARGNNGAQLQPIQLALLIAVYSNQNALPDLAAIAESFGESKRGAPTKTLILAAIARHEKRYDDAIQLLNAVDPSRRDYRVIRAIVDCALDANNLNLAVTTLRTAAVSSPNSNYWQELFQLHVNEGNMQQAVEALTAQAEASNSPHHFSNAIRWMTREQLYAEAQTFYTNHRKILRRPQIARTTDQEFLQAYIKYGAFKDTVENDIITPQNRHLEAQVHFLASAVHESGARALGLMEAALTKYPNNVTLLRGLAQLLGRTDRIREAIPLWARLVELQPDHIDDHIQYANVLQRDNRRDEAAAMLAAWTEARPSITRIEWLIRYLDPQRDPAAYHVLRDRILAGMDPSDRAAAASLFAPLDAQADQSEDAA